MSADQSRDGMLGGPKAEPKGLQAEDNYTIEVWDREGGELIGICLRTSLWSVQCRSWPEAIIAYPGLFLIRKNGHFVIGTAQSPDDSVLNEAGLRPAYKNIALDDLPQWYALVARCSCGNKRHLDRYALPVSRWKAYSLAEIEAKLSCTPCDDAGREGSVELGLEKLPR